MGGGRGGGGANKKVSLGDLLKMWGTFCRLKSKIGHQRPSKNITMLLGLKNSIMVSVKLYGKYLTTKRLIYLVI